MSMTVVRCPYCVSDAEFRQMIARPEGRFFCGQCGHSEIPSNRDFSCSCRKPMAVSASTLELPFVHFRPAALPAGFFLVGFARGPFRVPGRSNAKPRAFPGHAESIIPRCSLANIRSRSGCVVGKPYLEITSRLPVIRPESMPITERGRNPTEWDVRPMPALCYCQHEC